MSEYSKEFLKLALGRLQAVYTGYKGQGALFNPLSVVDTFASAYRGAGLKNKKGVEKLGDALEVAGKTVVAKLVHGPVLNITLLGIPFIISTAVSAKKNVKTREKKGRVLAKELKIRKDVKLQIESARKKENQLTAMKNIRFSNLKALDAAPYSNVFLPIYYGLLKCNVSEPTARDVAQSGASGYNQSFKLSESDLDGIITFLEAYCEDA